MRAQGRTFSKKQRERTLAARYRSTALMKNSPPFKDHHRALGMSLLKGPREYPGSEVQPSRVVDDGRGRGGALRGEGGMRGNADRCRVDV